jgi:hypothetical protein
MRSLTCQISLIEHDQKRHRIKLPRRMPEKGRERPTLIFALKTGHENINTSGLTLRSLSALSGAI